MHPGGLVALLGRARRPARRRAAAPRRPTRASCVVVEVVEEVDGAQVGDA